jgi:hypothetical protein
MTALNDFFAISNINGDAEQLIWNKKRVDKILQQAPHGIIFNLNLFTGASLGYSILSVSNELGSDYMGELKSEPHFAPFLGLHLYFWENLPGFFNNLLVTSKV